MNAKAEMTWSRMMMMKQLRVQIFPESSQTKACHSWLLHNIAEDIWYFFPVNFYFPKHQQVRINGHPSSQTVQVLFHISYEQSAVNIRIWCLMSELKIWSGSVWRSDWSHKNLMWDNFTTKISSINKNLIFLGRVTSRHRYCFISRNVLVSEQSRIYDIDSIFDGYIQTLTTLLFAAWHDPLTLLLVLLCCCASSSAWPHDPGAMSGVAYCPISIIILTIYYGKYSAASSGPGHWCHHYPAAKHWPSWRLDTDEMSDVCNPSSGCLQFCLWETRDREEEAAWSGRDDGHAS